MDRQAQRDIRRRAKLLPTRFPRLPVSRMDSTLFRLAPGHSDMIKFPNFYTMRTDIVRETVIDRTRNQ